jgi:hypothetical protein
LNLTLESVGADAQRQIGRQDFHDDFTVESILGCEEDLGHSAAAELALYRVGCSQGCLQLFEQHRCLVTDRGEVRGVPKVDWLIGASQFRELEVSYDWMWRAG